jgi:starch synthase
MQGRPLRVLVAASEAVGFAKTGGLADVVGSLPIALARRGIDARVVIPLYRGARETGRCQPTDVHLHIPVGAQTYHGRVWWAHLPHSNVPVYLIEQSHFFDRDDSRAGHGIYQYSDNGSKRDYPDNGERYIFFNRALLEMFGGLDFWPDLLHANDWQTGLVPAYLRELYGHQSPGYARIRTLFTIHNIAYQGQFPPLMMAMTGLDHHLFRFDKLEFYGNLCFLKAGICYADAISTVSPRYAEEIQTGAFGCGLESTLQARRHKLHGIVNGVDYDAWDPANDPYLPVRYDVRSVFQNKPFCKAALQRRFGLPEWRQTPLLGMVARLADQKGIDLLLHAGEEILRRDTQIVFLGDGDPHYQHWLQELRNRNPERVGVYFGFSEELAHLVEAGSDAFLMPSKYEPSGLNQLYSLRYGTVPIVRSVGGLYDTIVDCNEDTVRAGLATGFKFGPYTGSAFLGAVERALHCYRHRGDVWTRLIQAGMTQDWSWDRSAGEYVRLYGHILES